MNLRKTPEVLAGFRHRLGAALILVTAFVCSLFGFEALHGRSAMEDAARQPGGWLGVVAIVAGSAVIHELLHAFGWVAFARLPGRSISVRRTLRVMGFIASPDAAMPVGAFRIATLLPAVVLGGGSLAVGLATDQGLFVLWSCFLLVECYSDFTVLLATAGLPAAARVREYPERLGCEIQHLPP